MTRSVTHLLSIPLLCLGMLLSTGAAHGLDPFDAAMRDVQQRWAVANYEMRGKPRLTALQTLTQEADRLTLAYPDRAEAWIWSGIIRATIAGREGGLRALAAARAARTDLERALALDPNALGGLAYAWLGAIYYRVPSWPVGFGDPVKAEEMLQRALQINPEGIHNNFFYGEFLLEQGHRRRAVQYLLRAQQAPPQTDQPLADSGLRREIAKLLRQADS